MIPIAFYHTQGETPATLDATLPSLLEKAFKAGQKVLLLTPSEQRTQRLDESLWTYSPTSFLPHGTESSPHPDSQPILITHQLENPPPLANRIPVLLAGTEAALPTLITQNPPKILYLFNASQPNLEIARPLFKQLKTSGHPLQYWQQTPQGWQQKN